MQDSSRLDEARRAHDRDKIAALLAARFEQQRDVERHQRATLGGRAPQKSLCRQANAGVEQGFEAFERRSIAKHPTPKLAAVDPSVADHAGECGLNRLDSGGIVAQQTMDLGIGIVNRNSKPA